MLGNDPNKPELFPYTCTFKGKKRILLWQSNASGGDDFKVDAEGRLIAARSESELIQFIGDEAQEVRWEEGAEIDMDRFFNSLRNLRAGTASSEETCNILLNGWNFIEDLARTLHLDEELQRLRVPLLEKTYQKLFYGNNLPSVTPEGKSYSPVWIEEEIKMLKKAILLTWNRIEVKHQFEEQRD